MKIDNNNLDLAPGTMVKNISSQEWGMGQAQSCINGKVTINFENVGKKTLNIDSVELKIVDSYVSR